MSRDDGHHRQPRATWRACWAISRRTAAWSRFTPRSSRAPPSAGASGSRPSRWRSTPRCVVNCAGLGAPDLARRIVRARIAGVLPQALLRKRPVLHTQRAIAVPAARLSGGGSGWPRRTRDARSRRAGAIRSRRGMDRRRRLHVRRPQSRTLRHRDSALLPGPRRNDGCSPATRASGRRSRAAQDPAADFLMLGPGRARRHGSGAPARNRVARAHRVARDCRRRASRAAGPR